jgi:hypothetical protein
MRLMEAWCCKASLVLQTLYWCVERTLRVTGDFFRLDTAYSSLIGFCPLASSGRGKRTPSLPKGGISFENANSKRIFFGQVSFRLRALRFPHA